VDGGTIFLNEIGDMSLKSQARVLRILQERRFERVGGARTLEVDVRVIAASSRDLGEDISRGSFLADLFYRLNVVSFLTPPLRERKEDIPLLVEHFLDMFCRREGRDLKTMPADVVTMMKKYDWPGNVRELKNIIERLVIMTPERTITDKLVPGYITGEVNRETGIPGMPRLDAFLDINSLREARDEFEKEFIIQKLEENDWNISKTADSIELERSNLQRKIKIYGIDLRK
jgi:two-component system nitrogen regulation response regulator NtrX